jgi:hypothetical protein
MVIKVAGAGPRGPGINPGALQISMVAKKVSSDDDSDIDDIAEAIESIVDVTNTVYDSDITDLDDYDSCDEAQLHEPSNGSDTLIQRDDAYNDSTYVTYEDIEDIYSSIDACDDDNDSMVSLEDLVMTITDCVVTAHDHGFYISSTVMDDLSYIIGSINKCRDESEMDLEQYMDSINVYNEKCHENITAVGYMATTQQPQQGQPWEADLWAQSLKKAEKKMREIHNLKPDMIIPGTLQYKLNESACAMFRAKKKKFMENIKKRKSPRSPGSVTVTDKDLNQYLGLTEGACI